MIEWLKAVDLKSGGLWFKSSSLVELLDQPIQILNSLCSYEIISLFIYLVSPISTIVLKNKVK